MHHPRRLRVTVSIILCFVLQAFGADKYTDENRPYEFGFKIDGQQHRHESKDKDGIIMGEFGFVTADDVYHVTVYATDKEGRFKILSMKNIHLKSTQVSSLGAPSSARQGHSLVLPPAQPASVNQQASMIPQELPKQGGIPTPALSATPARPPLEPPGRSCSSCSLPTTTTRAPPPAFNQGNENISPNQFRAPAGSPQNQQAFPSSSPTQQNSAQNGPSGSPYNPQGGQPAFPASSPGQQSTAQGGPSGSPYNPQGSQPAFPASSSGQQNIAQTGPSGSSYNPQEGQPAFPASSPVEQNIVQAGPSDSSFNPQRGQPAFPPSPAGQQTTAQGGLSGSSYNPQGGQPAFRASSPAQQNTIQGGSSGSSYNPQGNQPSYASGQQNIPQQGLVAPDAAQLYAPQPGQAAPNYPGSPSYFQGPGSSNVPNNYAQPQGQTQAGAENQAGIFDDNNPYTGAGPSGFASSVPDAGNAGQNNPQGGSGERTAKQYNGPGQQFDSAPNGFQSPGPAQGGPRGSAKPTLFSAQMQIVDKNTDIYALGPNEQKGLPPGLTQSDVSQLLYTFNYTLGFHGHFEEGYTNGVKKGYYFVTGRNGVRTRIDYVADDTGFHPKVSQDVLDLLSEEVPKPDTEKDEKYGLKGYEFKWLYYPVESKRR